MARLSRVVHGLTEVFWVYAHLMVTPGPRNWASCGGKSRRKIITRMGGRGGAACPSAKWVFSGKSSCPSICHPAPSCTKNAFLGHLPINQHSSSPVASRNEQKPTELLLCTHSVPDPGQGAPSQLTPTTIHQVSTAGPISQVETLRPTEGSELRLAQR